MTAEEREAADGSKCSSWGAAAGTRAFAMDGNRAAKAQAREMRNANYDAHIRHTQEQMTRGTFVY